MKMLMPFFLLIFTLTYLIPTYARDDFPSCYGLIDEDSSVQTAKRELFVIVDQTLVFDVDTKRKIHKKIHRFLSPGDRVTLVTFSAYAADRYASMSLSGQLDMPLEDDKRHHIGIPKLKKFDRCMHRQKMFVKRTVDAKLKQAFENASTELPKTELTGSLSNFGDNLISKSKASEKIVLIVSDMLENSDVVSFYSQGEVVPVDIKKSLAQLKDMERITDWAGANVYVVGAAYVQNGEYRSEKVLRNIRGFWEEFFFASNAKLIAWGQPELLVDIN